MIVQMAVGLSLSLGFITMVQTYPAIMGFATPMDMYGSLRPINRAQRSHPAMGSMYHPEHPMFRRSQFSEPELTYRGPYPGMYHPPSPYHHAPMQHDGSQLRVVPRGMDDEISLSPLKTSTKDGFDEEDQAIIQEEMNDPMLYVDKKPSKYEDPLMKSSYSRDIIPPMTQWPRTGGYTRLPLVQPDDLEPQINYQYEEFRQNQQKRFQPQHQYFQPSPYNYQQPADHGMAFAGYGHHYLVQPQYPMMGDLFQPHPYPSEIPSGPRMVLIKDGDHLKETPFDDIKLESIERGDDILAEMMGSQETDSEETDAMLRIPGSASHETSQHEDDTSALTTAIPDSNQEESKSENEESADDNSDSRSEY